MDIPTAQAGEADWEMLVTWAVRLPARLDPRLGCTAEEKEHWGWGGENRGLWGLRNVREKQQPGFD